MYGLCVDHNRSMRNYRGWELQSVHTDHRRSMRNYRGWGLQSIRCFLAAAVTILGSVASAAPGTATYYDGYILPACGGYQQQGEMLASVSDPLWGDRGACGNIYSVTCVSLINRRCKIGASVTVKVVDYCPSGCSATFSLTPEAFSQIADESAGIIFIEYSRASSRNDSLPPLGEIAPGGFRETRTKNTPTAHFAPIVIGLITSGGFIIFVLVVVLILRVRRQRKSKKTEDVEDYNIKQIPGMPVQFSYEDLRVATEDFKERLGRGGFGSVFKGELPDGTGIAVKRLDKLGQEKWAFLAEVETIGSLHHFNLVKLIGFCAEKSHRLLVYEYMSNGSLDNWIFKEAQGSCLDWQTRKRIILDIAKGLAYLHEECRQTIMHLDIKPQNILLDPNFNAKISDFGLSKVVDRAMGQVQISMRGTPGYLAPEWCQSLGHVTVKVDTYSFGIVLLEVACGRRNVAHHSQQDSTYHLLRMLQRKAESDRVIDIVRKIDDESTRSHEEEAIRMIKIGAWCLQDDPERRPSMSTVVKVLEGVMEVESNIVYEFKHALISSNTTVNNRVSSSPPTASVLSNPR